MGKGAIVRWIAGVNLFSPEARRCPTRGLGLIRAQQGDQHTASLCWDPTEIIPHLTICFNNSSIKTCHHADEEESHPPDDWQTNQISHYALRCKWGNGQSVYTSLCVVLVVIIGLRVFDHLWKRMKWRVPCFDETYLITKLIWTQYVHYRTVYWNSQHIQSDISQQMDVVILFHNKIQILHWIFHSQID